MVLGQHMQWITTVAVHGKRTHFGPAITHDMAVRPDVQWSCLMGYGVTREFKRDLWIETAAIHATQQFVLFRFVETDANSGAA